MRGKNSPYLWVADVTLDHTLTSKGQNQESQLRDNSIHSSFWFWVTSPLYMFFFFTFTSKVLDFSFFK